MAKGLGASLWAWLNKEGATAYLQRTLADERIRRDKAEAEAAGDRRRLQEAEKERNAERKARDLAEAKLAQADRALALANEDRADLCKRLASALESQAAMTARLIAAACDADDFLELAESYAADVEELRRRVDDACGRLASAA